MLNCSETRPETAKKEEHPKLLTIVENVTRVPHARLGAG